VIVTDRFLTALAAYLVDAEALAGYTPRLRDWEGVKTDRELILDADEAEEHEIMRGCFAVDGVVALRVHARDHTSAERHALLSGLRDAMVEETAAAWMSAASNSRGLVVGEGLTVFEVRTDDGTWEVEDDRVVGKIEFSAMVVGADQ
jgi:hypothetical protein|tara:strand:- start:1092 stop:1532 length:441 start_codon:yes stop_codon:yes gene_type:complete